MENFFGRKIMVNTENGISKGVLIDYDLDLGILRIKQEKTCVKIPFLDVLELKLDENDDKNGIEMNENKERGSEEGVNQMEKKLKKGEVDKVKDEETYLSLDKNAQFKPIDKNNDDPSLAKEYFYSHKVDEKKNLNLSLEKKEQLDKSRDMIAPLNTISSKNNLAGLSSSKGSSPSDSSHKKEPSTVVNKILTKTFDSQKRKGFFSRIMKIYGPSEETLSSIFSYNIAKAIGHTHGSVKNSIQIVTKGTDIYNKIGYHLYKMLTGYKFLTELKDLNTFISTNVSKEFIFNKNTKTEKTLTKEKIILYAMNREEIKNFKLVENSHYHIFLDVNLNMPKNKNVCTFLIGPIPEEYQSIHGPVYYIDGGYDLVVANILGHTVPINRGYIRIK